MSEHRVVLVTGAARGIGRAVAVALAGPGREVVVNYRSREDAARETAAMVEERGGAPRLLAFDVADEGGVKAAFKDLVKTCGRLDVLVNNAGIARDNLLATMKSGEWDEVMDVNLKGMFLCCQGAIRPMMRQRYGRIVNITSVVGFLGNAGQCNYSASKAGIVGFTRSLAREVVSRNIAVNAVAPGFIETDMTEALGEKAREALMKQIPSGRLGAPEDVAAAVKFLASEESGYITGQVIHVNGGMFMG